MSCEKYQAALIAAAASVAASDVEPSPDLRAHLNGCAACRDRAEQQRSLVAAIDNSVRRAVNAPLPPALLQRFEARLAQQAAPAPIRSSRLRWIYATAALATAALIVLLVSHPRSNKPNPQIAQLTPAMQRANPSPDPPTYLTHLPPPQETVAPRTKTRMTNVSARKEPEVLVPPDDRIAFEHFINDFDRGEILAAALAKRVPLQELRVAPVDVPDIQTASLKVSPVQESQAIANR
jgi:hypothetical protein